MRPGTYTGYISNKTFNFFFSYIPSEVMFFKYFILLLILNKLWENYLLLNNFCLVCCMRYNIETNRRSYRVVYSLCEGCFSSIRSKTRQQNQKTLMPWTWWTFLYIFKLIWIVWIWSASVRLPEHKKKMLHHFWRDDVKYFHFKNQIYGQVFRLPSHYSN